MKSTLLIRLSIGLIYFFFGIIKFFPHQSPAETLVKETIEYLTFGYIPGDLGILMLALGETCIGIMLILNYFIPIISLFALIHMILTFIPFIIFTEATINQETFGLTLLGQYIAKNIIIISAIFSLVPLSKFGLYFRFRISSLNFKKINLRFLLRSLSKYSH